MARHREPQSSPTVGQLGRAITRPEWCYTESGVIVPTPPAVAWAVVYLTVAIPRSGL